MIDIQISKEISNLINTELLSISNSDVYNLLDKEIKVADLNQIFKSLLQNKSQLKNVGIDLPLSFGDYHSAINKTMVVALDPKRNDKSNAIHNKKTPVEISIGSIFSLHTEEGKKTGKNSYWDFISYISNSGFVYVTDIYKIYYETKDETGQILLSNKDKALINKDKALIAAKISPYEQNVSILKKEIEIIKPDRIITLGKDAKNAVKKILELPENNDEVIMKHNGKEFVFLPHISTTVTQSIKTIGDLYKGLGIITNQQEIISIGVHLLANRKIEDILK